MGSSNEKGEQNFTGIYLQISSEQLPKVKVIERFVKELLLANICNSSIPVLPLY